MKKIETLWHHLLYCALVNKQFQYTQKELAIHFDFSLSTVNHALKIPERIGAIRKTSKFFILEDYFKLLYFWASLRNLNKDIIYQTYVDEPVGEIEGLLPNESIYACYSAGRKIMQEPPADYDKVYFYFNKSKIELISNRFPNNSSKPPNLLALTKTYQMEKYGSFTSVPQTFVDLWGLKDWFARDFIKALEEKINGLL